MNREEFIENVEKCQKGLRLFLTALCCGDTQTADDIAQESLVKAYLSSDGIQSPEKFKSWLHKIAYNTFLNRKRGARLTVGYEEAGQTVSSMTADNSFRYQELHEALRRLPERERMALLLFYMEGYQVKEIAVIVDASQESVKQYLSRGRKHLRDIMKK